ncbi:MAG: hypothetical protein PHX04_04165 [Bacilli bacterium]|nr:hypothetical protein [Bacilli bacterium]
MDNYKKLQELIKVYEETEIWKYIDGDDIFKLNGFDDNVYVSIMGNAGIEYSIGIYYGDDDLFSQLDIVYGEYSTSPDASIHLGTFKIALGKPEKLLSDANRKILKKNKIKPVNVVFRFNPGRIVRLVTEEECLLLIEILNRIIKVADYIINNEMDFEKDFRKMYNFSEKDGKVLVRKINYPKLKAKDIKQEKLDVDLVSKGNWITPKGTYNVFLVYAPMYDINTGDYPVMLLVQNNKNYLVVGMELIESKNTDKIASKVLAIFINNKIIPNNIIFNSSLISNICSEFIKEFKIKVHINNENDDLNLMWNSIGDSLGKL